MALSLLQRPDMHTTHGGWMALGMAIALVGCAEQSDGDAAGEGGSSGSASDPCPIPGTCLGSGETTGDAGSTGDAGTGASSGSQGSGGAPGDGGAPGQTGGTGGSGSSSSSGTGGAPAGSADAYFPAASWFYQDISSAPVAAGSSTTTQWLANNGGWGTGQMRIDFSIEVLSADASTPLVSFQPTGDFFNPDCDHVPVPVPAGGALEGESGYQCASDGDCHLIVRNDADGRLYEMWRANIVNGSFQGGCLAAWDMTRLYGPQGRGDQCSSADAAGFPIAPLLISPDEVAAGEITHAIRFILPNPRMRAGTFVSPANHAGAPSGPSQAPVYGSRWRLRADYPVDTLPSEGARVVARAMQKYGMALADGGNIALTAQSDRFTAAKWTNVLSSHDLAALDPTDFQVIDTGTPESLTYDCTRTTY